MKVRVREEKNECGRERKENQVKQMNKVMTSKQTEKDMTENV